MLVSEKPLGGVFLYSIYTKITYMGIINYFRETKSEMRHVTWPTVRQTVVFTVAVIIVSILVAVLLGFFDYIFSTYVIQNIIN